MTPLVIDASVAIKWVVQEQGTAEALLLRHRRLAAPDLLVAECANILWKKVRRRELTEEEARFATRLLQNVEIELVPMRRLMPAAVELALALGHPAYDCLYLALGEASGWDVVTADDRFRVKASGAKTSIRVLDLKTATPAPSSPTH